MTWLCSNHSLFFFCPFGLLFSSSITSLVIFFSLLSFSALLPFGLLYLSNFSSLCLISSFLSFSPSGTRSWLGFIIAGCFCSGYNPSEIESSLIILPNDANHSIFPETDLAISSLSTTMYVLSIPLLIPRIAASCIFLNEYWLSSVSLAPPSSALNTTNPHFIMGNAGCVVIFQTKSIGPVHSLSFLLFQIPFLLQ